MVIRIGEGHGIPVDRFNPLGAVVRAGAPGQRPGSPLRDRRADPDLGGRVPAAGAAPGPGPAGPAGPGRGGRPAVRPHVPALHPVLPLAAPGRGGAVHHLHPAVRHPGGQPPGPADVLAVPAHRRPGGGRDGDLPLDLAGPPRAAARVPADAGVQPLLRPGPGALPADRAAHRQGRPRAHGDPLPGSGGGGPGHGAADPAVGQGGRHDPGPGGGAALPGRGRLRAGLLPVQRRGPADRHGTLAIFNNAKIPLAILASALVFHERVDWLRLAGGGAVIALALALNAWAVRARALPGGAIMGAGRGGR